MRTQKQEDYWDFQCQYSPKKRNKIERYLYLNAVVTSINRTIIQCRSNQNETQPGVNDLNTSLHVGTRPVIGERSRDGAQPETP